MFETAPDSSVVYGVLRVRRNEMSAEDREVLQRYVNESFDRFKAIVREGRPQFREDPDALDRLATGEIFSAEQAKNETDMQRENGW